MSKFFNKNTKNTIIQFIKFGIVGISNNIIAYLINITVLFFLNRYNITFDFVIANIFAFLISVLWSFYWNNKYVFNKKSDNNSKKLKILIKTYIAYSFTGIFLNNILSLLWISIFDISKYIAPILNLIISVPLNFIINKFWAYK